MGHFDPIFFGNPGVLKLKRKGMGESFEQLCKLGHFDPKMGDYGPKL